MCASTDLECGEIVTLSEDSDLVDIAPIGISEYMNSDFGSETTGLT